MFEQWVMARKDWKQSQLLVQIKTQHKGSKVGARRWMLRKEIAKRYESEEIADEICDFKEKDPVMCKTCVRDNPEPALSHRKEYRQYLVWDESYETTTEDTIVSSLCGFSADEATDDPHAAVQLSGKSKGTQKKEKEEKCKKKRKRSTSASSSEAPSEKTSETSKSESTESSSKHKKKKKSKRKTKEKKVESKSKSQKDKKGKKETKERSEKEQAKSEPDEEPKTSKKKAKEAEQEEKKRKKEELKEEKNAWRKRRKIKRRKWQRRSRRRETMQRRSGAAACDVHRTVSGHQPDHEHTPGDREEGGQNLQCVPCRSSRVCVGPSGRPACRKR